MNTTVHQILIGVHIAAGIVALIAGAAAVAVRKGGGRHAVAGTWFCAAMLVLGVSAAILEPFRKVPGSPINGVLVCYFVATAWMTARWRGGKAGRFEAVACVVALVTAALMLWGAFTGAATPVGRGPIFAIAGLCLYAGLLDLSVVTRKTLSPARRLARHSWRMCFAFFIATGSFFLGQQKVMPAVLRGSPVLFVLALAPLAILLFWLVRIRFPKAVGKFRLRGGTAAAGIATISSATAVAES